MKVLERVHGVAGIKIMVGSAFLWAWLDALFMSAFFIAPESRGFMSEMAAIAVFSFSVPWVVIAMLKRPLFERLLANRKLLLACGAFGTLGSLLMLLAGIGSSWFTLLAGGVCGGIFMGVYELAWGAAYCHDGAKSATPYVVGGFACAVVIDAPMLFMIPEAAAFFFALLPIISSIFFVLVEPEKRTYRTRDEASRPDVPNKRGLQESLKSYLGISMTLLCAVVLVMVGFGYVQHLVSFSSVAGSNLMGGIVIQVARGITSVVMLVIIVVLAWKSSTVYRVGLLAMIAGFMVMSFTFGTQYFWISGAIIIAGYTAFDLLIWVAFSQIAHTQSKDPLRTIGVMRLLAIACYVIGAGFGMGLIGSGEHLHGLVSAETTLVGYLVVIAVVLVLSCEDVWILFNGARFITANSPSADESATLEQRLDPWFAELGLTAREKEIAVLLTSGRTQPWIAQHLGISENTVGTHVRHIYQKSEVHSRQEFIDLALSMRSPERREAPSHLTEVA